MLRGTIGSLKSWFRAGPRFVKGALLHQRRQVELREEIERCQAQIVETENRHRRQQTEQHDFARRAVANLILHASEDAYFDCVLNSARVWLPRETLRTMIHCIQPNGHGPNVVAVETRHTDWLREKLQSGDRFLDVGAATGAMTLPIALSLPEVAIIAFEPNRTTNRILRETLLKNGIKQVEVHDCAVSDATGSVTFAELSHDPTGRTPYMPEASAILTDTINRSCLAGTYEARVVTLDGFFENRTDASSVRSVKIDVEGFEVHVVRGAARFLARVKPYLAIDIHRDPFGTGTTEKKTRSCLAPFGYRCEMCDHVLLCSPV